MSALQIGLLVAFTYLSLRVLDSTLEAQVEAMEGTDD